MAKVTETNKESIFSLIAKGVITMPGDTVSLTTKPDTLGQAGSATPYHMAHTDAVTGSNPPSTGTVPFLFVGGLLLFFLVLRPAGARAWRRFRWEQTRKQAMNELDANYAEFDSRLSGYNSYYNGLPQPLRRRFLERVTVFMDSKKFQYVDIAAEEKMPLLISAAAIQLTFGLDKFMLDFFDTIYVLRQDYRYGAYNIPFEGHVNSSGIYLSWDSFLKGYADYTDANNVGVHEMAHALAYVNFMAGPNDGVDREFKKRFRDFSKVARPVFNAMQRGSTNLLGTYAATNYNEFWAVAVENFFERPWQMKSNLPQLYEAMCLLLNQDPMLVDKGLGREEGKS